RVENLGFYILRQIHTFPFTFAFLRAEFLILSDAVRHAARKAFGSGSTQAAWTVRERPTLEPRNRSPPLVIFRKLA
ncbi:MAG: hypothetical protein LBE78_10215, partial [Burkholderiaceae bacterium]|nr:hypothetical protein [Burkholderiaceae bacterium]